MDGDFPRREPPPAGSVLYGRPPLQAPLCAASVENAMLHYPCWTGYFPPALYPAFSSDSHPLVSSASYLCPAGGQPCPDTSYAPAATASFLPKSSDFPQDCPYLGDLSPASLFSSSVDSLSDIADTPDFLPADSLSHVPTIWDVGTASPAHDKLFLPSSQFTGLEDPVSSLPATPLLVSYQAQAQPEEDDEAEEDEAEELGHTETYADYAPSKSKVGKHHPDRVVETSTLSSVPPPDITYSLTLPAASWDSGALSALQLEAITYACQQHEVLLPSGQRAGFLIGDGAGVGKGRTVAGIIFENYLKGRKKALWFSVSNDLKYDAERDLRDIEAPGIAVHALSKIKYGDSTTSEGVLFATYSALIGESQAGGQHRTRLRQILEWCGEAFDGVVSCPRGRVGGGARNRGRQRRGEQQPPSPASHAGALESSFPGTLGSCGVGSGPGASPATARPRHVLRTRVDRVWEARGPPGWDSGPRGEEPSNPAPLPRRRILRPAPRRFATRPRCGGPFCGPGFPLLRRA